MTKEERKFPPFTDEEIAEAFRYLRRGKFSHLMPPRRSLHVDWFLMRAIAREVTRRRDLEPNAVLPMLVGSVVREYIPDTNPKLRELGMAYRNGVMKMLSRRAHLQEVHRYRAEAEQKVGPTDETGQRRLI